MNDSISKLVKYVSLSVICKDHRRHHLKCDTSFFFDPSKDVFEFVSSYFPDAAGFSATCIGFDGHVVDWSLVSCLYLPYF